MVLASQVPTKPLEETFYSIASKQVHVPSSYPHHLLSQNTESNHVMLSSGSSQSIHSKKYIHWTKEEHRSFLLGLEEYKESRWEKISEKFVPSKTPTQVVSHAKKFFKWKNAPKKERKRRSIHETTLDDIDMIVTPHIDQHNWLPPPPNFAGTFVKTMVAVQIIGKKNLVEQQLRGHIILLVE
ncbi:hypothetical protein JHK87_055698 [Glycine soja]|nr:hypothetical protein JHK87_055698 [Glycine soja]